MPGWVPVVLLVLSPLVLVAGVVELLRADGSGDTVTAALGLLVGLVCGVVGWLGRPRPSGRGDA
ncbi:hypothetical protein GC722_00425 [Auraticoccus sp. F435]|uniref:Uncharacterized protein n=1 Tax=Auraticoccus cholistanensis TaxID=2656650 RepID=A0A6A9UTJ4_9ACTN|nr:hypothetical protein [Auraticoccus cholistanensis]MVA74507.1 hypothetical protein [Auraticoccus cholistanensis]